MLFKCIKLLGFYFLLVAIYFNHPEIAYANAPAVNGRVVSADTNAPIAGVWVRWSDSATGVWYTRTDSSGYYRFPSWNVLWLTGVSQSYLTENIDTNLDGSNDSVRAHLADPVTAPLYNFGCGSNAHSYTVVKPASMQGTFTTVGPMNINNGNADLYIDDILFIPDGPPPTPTPTPVPTYNVTGNVFIDADRDGIKDAGEGNYSGARVTYTGGSSNYTFTNGSGNYTLDNMIAGNYAISLTVPSGYTNTTPLAQNVTLGPGAVVNFGIGQLYVITGNVFIDGNKNRIKDGSDANHFMTPIITATRNGLPIGTVQTSPGGYYQIRDLTPGSVTVTFSSLPVDYYMTHPLNGPPPAFQVIVGPGCDVSNALGASCY